MGKNETIIFLSKVNIGTLPSTRNKFLVLLDSICAVTAMITKCDKSQNATAGIPELSQFVTNRYDERMVWIPAALQGKHSMIIALRLTNATTLQRIFHANQW